MVTIVNHICLKNQHPRKVLVNYANMKFEDARKIQRKYAKLAGFTDIYEYNPDDIGGEYKSIHHEIFLYERGDGLWIWKPYIINKTLKMIDEGDIILYCDSGAFFFKSAKSIFKIINQKGIWVSELPLIEKQFTKRKVFETMKMVDVSFLDSAQISGSFFGMKKDSDSEKIVEEWLSLCENIDILSPADCNDEESYFVSHREDQSIFSLVIKKNNIKPYSDPSQYGRLPEKYFQNNWMFKYHDGIPGKQDYPICVIHHRTPDGNTKVIIRQLLCAILPRKIGLMFIK